MTQTIRHAVIVCHPAEESFTGSVADRYIETARAHGHEVAVRDLYRMNFDPVLQDEERSGQPGEDVVREWAELGKPDIFVLVYPIWFGAPPARMLGYVDRVFGAGRVFGLGEEGGLGERLAGKRLVSFTSSGRSNAWLAERGVLASLRTTYDRYLTDVFHLAETARYHTDNISPDLAAHEAEQHLAAVEDAAKEVIGRLTGAWTPPKSNWMRGLPQS